MSKEVMVLVRCDRCNRPADENLSVTQDISISFAKAAAEVDLCAECQEKARAEVVAWISVGRKPVKVKVPTPRKQVPASWSEDNEVVCGVGGCEHKAKNPHGLTVHKSRAHGIKGEKRHGSKRAVRPARKTTRKATARRVTAKA